MVVKFTGMGFSNRGRYCGVVQAVCSMCVLKYMGVEKTTMFNNDDVFDIGIYRRGQ